MRYSELFETQNLNEYKEIFDLRHQNVEDKFKFFGSSKNSGYISPERGYHFLYYKGALILSSTDNENYSWLVSSGKWKALDNKSNISNILHKEAPRILSKAWNKLSGVVDLESQTITIAKESAGDRFRQRDIVDLQEFKKALVALKKHGVTDSFVVKGVPNLPKTVGQILELEDYTQKALSKEPMTFYHGTSLVRWEKIQREGLVPGNAGEAYVDLIPGYSEHNVYLGVTPKVAEFYGKRQKQKDNDNGYVILKVHVTDKDKLMPDDRYASRWEDDPETGHRKQVYDKSRMGAGMKRSLRDAGEIAYRGRIPPKNIELVKKYK